MRIWRSQFAHLLTLLLLAGLAAQPAVAQRSGKGQHPHGENARSGPARAPRSEASKKAERDMRALPPRWMERLREMSPDEQERFLENNERFKNLPPERQAQIRRRLQNWNSLAPEQQRAVRERERVWQQMSPEQRRGIREEILPRWQQLPADRRQVLLGRLRALRDLNDAQQAAKLKDEAFLSGLSPDERVMLRGLSKLRVGTPPEPPQDNP